jgi:hypothetical protein
MTTVLELHRPRLAAALSFQRAFLDVASHRGR